MMIICHGKLIDIRLVWAFSLGEYKEMERAQNCGDLVVAASF